MSTSTNTTQTGPGYIYGTTSTTRLLISGSASGATGITVNPNSDEIFFIPYAIKVTCLSSTASFVQLS
jgi:hypothetical protein